MATFEVKWGAGRVTLGCFALTSYEARVQINAIPLAVMQFTTQTLDKASADLVSCKVGAEVLVELNGTTLFQGTVQRQQTSLTQNHATLVITAVHKLQLLRYTIKSAVHSVLSGGRRSANQVVQGILSSCGLTASSVAGLDTEYEQLVQHGVTDWAFICRLIALDGAWLIPSASSFSIGSPVPANRARRTHTLMGASTHSVLLEGQWTSDIEHFNWASISAWDINEQRLSAPVRGNRASLGSGFFDTERLKPFLGGGIHLSHGKALVGVSGRAEGLKLDRELAALRASFTLEGVQSVLDMHVGDAIELTDFCVALDGKVVISALHHRLVADVWTTEVSVGQPMPLLDAISEIAKPSTLLTGKVAEYPAQADSLGRVRITIPAIDPNTPLWARLATPLAGDGIGLCFYPGVDDEVLLQFVEGDLSQPVIIGSVHNPKRPAPFAPSTSGIRQGGVIFDSELYLTFDRHCREGLAGEWLIEKRIELKSRDELTLESNLVQLQGAQALELTAKAMVLESDTTFDLKGQNVELKGQTVDIVGQSIDLKNTPGTFDTQVENS